MNGYARSQEDITSGPAADCRRYSLSQPEEIALALQELECCGMEKELPVAELMSSTCLLETVGDAPPFRSGVQLG
jgi:hypothetical protein